jgi:hypothetical protein
MPEKIVPRSPTTAGRFITEALRLGKVRQDRLMVNVQLLVDGAEVPFTATLNVMAEQFQQALEEEAKVLAEELVMGAGLSEAIDTLREAQMGVRRVIQLVRAKAPDPDETHVERV